MRVLLCYGVISGGGCERRMGDLVRWLLDNGDEAWIAASTFNGLGEAVVHGQCGVPLDRVFYMEPGGIFEDFLYLTAHELAADIVDVQWHLACPPEFPCPAVATLHGIVPPPPAGLVRGIITVENSADIEHHARAFGLRTETIWNWVNLNRFPFQPKLGEGMCFIGRSFKAVNPRKVAPFYDGVIECYGTSHAPITDWPPNMRWHGFADAAEIMPRHRVVFGSAQIAMEAMASGRLAIAGQALHLPPGNMPGYVPEGCLVTPENVQRLARAQSFSYRYNEAEPTAEEVWADTQRALHKSFNRERRMLREWVEEYHSLDRQCGNIRQFYEEVLG